MEMFDQLKIAGTGMSAERFRMDTISSNIANATVTRTETDGEPYRRKVALFQESLERELTQAQTRAGRRTRMHTVESMGVKAVGVAEDQSALRRVYDPGHPDADEEGYVMMPNVNILNEMVDMIASSRAYEANITAFNAGKSMFMRALEIGRA